MANSIYYGVGLDGVQVNPHADPTEPSATFDSRGYAEADPADTGLVASIKAQGGNIVDVEGTEEALTAGTVQTATTLSAIVFRNSTGSTVLNIRDEDASGTLVFGPITIAANAERVIVFPEQIPASVFATGVFIDVDSGGLHATPGFLIP